MLKFLRSILNGIRSFFRRVFNYSDHSNTENENTHQSTPDQSENQNRGKDTNKIHDAIEQNTSKGNLALDLISKASRDDVNTKNESGQTPLHLAIAAKHLGDLFSDERGNIVKALLTKGAKVNIQDKDEETVAHYIGRSLDENDTKVKINIYTSYQMNKILNRGIISAFEDFIERSLNVHIKSNEGNTALDRILLQSLQSE